MLHKKDVIAGVLLTGALLFLSGCSTIPQKIKGDSTLIATADFRHVVDNANLYKGREARFGGKVVNVINRPTETLIEIAVLPLDKGARPELDHPYQGRVFVTSPMFLEPLTFRHHLITVLGTVTGTSVGKIGAANYRFLTMNMLGYQIWQVDEQIMESDYWDYGIGPGWVDGWGTPGYPYGWGWYPDSATFTVKPVVTR